MIDYMFYRKDTNGKLYLLQHKQNNTYGLYSIAKKRWIPGYEDGYVDTELDLVGDNLVTTYVNNVNYKVFYTSQNVHDIDSKKVKITREYPSFENEEGEIDEQQQSLYKPGDAYVATVKSNSPTEFLAKTVTMYASQSDANSAYSSGKSIPNSKGSIVCKITKVISADNNGVKLQAVPINQNLGMNNTQMGWKQSDVVSYGGFQNSTNERSGGQQWITFMFNRTNDTFTIIDSSTDTQGTITSQDGNDATASMTHTQMPEDMMVPYYNYSLRDALNKEFFTTDYASNSKPNASQNLAEGKHVLKVSADEKAQILEMHKSHGYKMSIQEMSGAGKIEHHIENMISQLSDEEVHELLQQLQSVGITPNTTVKQAVNVVRREEQDNEMDMDENMKRRKAAEILSSIGTGLVGSTLVPLIPLGIGNAMNIGFTGGLAVHLGVAFLLIGLAKALGRKENSTEHGNY